MKGIPTEAGGLPPEKVDEAVDKYLHIRRCLNDDGKMYSHSKIVCIDQKLMYVGSDNLYPCYNEEHGIWVEDGVSTSSVKDWVNGFYTTYWGKCKAITYDEEQAFFDNTANIPGVLKPLYKDEDGGMRIYN
jgi:hypothetical protein